MRLKPIAKRICALSLSLSITISVLSSQFIPAFADSSTQNYITPYNYGFREISDNERVYYDKNYEITYKITSQWSGNQVVNLLIKNTGSEVIENWALLYDSGEFCPNVEGIWSAKFDSNEYFSYLTHNGTNAGDIQPKQTVSVGYTYKSNEKYFPKSIEIIQSRVEKDGGFSVNLSGIYGTLNGFSGQFVVKNDTDKIIYKPEITFTANFKLQSNWAYDILETSDNVYTIRSKYDKIITIAPNGQISLEISGTKINNASPQISDVSLTEVTVLTENFVQKDSDMDGLPDYYETILGTNKYAADSDYDNLPDGYEVFSLGSDPLKWSTDGSDISDGEQDFDGDGLSNFEEYLLETNPINSDSDDDGLNDGDEVHIYSTNPLNPDTDGDGLLDGEEGCNCAFYTKYSIYFSQANPS